MNTPELSKIYQGDCLEIMRGWPDKCVDLALTDPPYGIGISSNPFRQKHEKENWDDAPPGAEYFKEIFRVSKRQIIWGGNYFDLPPSQGFFVWDKYQPEDFSSSMCEVAWSSIQQPAKLFRYSVLTEKKQHPTQKPVALISWLFRFVKDLENVFDPYLGSGTTAVAAEKIGVPWVGIEKSPKYCAVAQERVDAETSQGKLF